MFSEEKGRDVCEGSERKDNMIWDIFSQCPSVPFVQSQNLKILRSIQEMKKRIKIEIISRMKRRHSY